MYRLAVLVLVTGCHVIFPLEEPPAPPDIPLRVYYTMDAITGTTVEDESEFDHLAVCVSGNCPAQVSAVRGGGFAFDGQVTSLRASSAPDLQGNQFTVAFWMRADDPVNSLGCMASKVFNGTKGHNSWLLCVEDGASLFIETDHEGIADIETDQRPVFDNQFHHVALTYDGVHRILYVDGIAGTRKELPLALDIDDGPITLGAEDDGEGLMFHFAGILDDFQIYDRALPEAEILSLATR